MRKTSTGYVYYLHRGTTPGYWTVWGESPVNRSHVQLGTVLKLADRQWEFVARGIYFVSGQNYVGQRATLKDAAEAVVLATRGT